MAAPVVLADANVLYKAVLRDLLMEIAVRRAIVLHWTDAIQEEWTRALLRNRPELMASQLQRTCAFMATALPDARVTGYEPLIDGLVLPDPDDRHVLAAAITAGASLVLTFNTADFPIDQSAPNRPIAVHPDSFLGLVCAAAPDVVLAAVQVIIRRTRPAQGGDANFVEALVRAELPETARQIARLLVSTP